MKIGILGRQPAMMARALALAREADHDAMGALDDAAMSDHIVHGEIEALVIGGGVESASRHAMRSLCAQRAVRVVEVAGPQGLVEALRSLV